MLSSKYFIRVSLDNGETPKLVFCIICPCPDLGEAKIPLKHYQLNRNKIRSRKANRGGIEQFMIVAVVRKPYHRKLMTEETQFYQVSTPVLLSKVFARGNSDGTKKG